MIQPAGTQADELIRRLQGWSSSSWRHRDRIAVTRSAVQRLADLAAGADTRPIRRVPDAGVHALADQLAVLLADAARAGVDPAVVDVVVHDLAAELGLSARLGR